jgi:hypothetical protein
VIRQILGGDGRKQQFIRTIHKKGFSFVTKFTLEHKAGDNGDLSLSKSTLENLKLPQEKAGKSRPANDWLWFNDWLLLAKNSYSSRMVANPDTQFLSILQLWIAFFEFSLIFT